MKIGFVSESNPFNDRKSWSGSIFKLREAVEKARFNVEWVTITPPSKLRNLIRVGLKVWYGSTLHHPFLNWIDAKYTDWEKAKECEMLFFPGGAQIMKYAPIHKPYIYFADANFNQMVDYYWHNLNKKLVSLANEEERHAIQNAEIILRSSQWSVDDAIEYYGGDPKKCHVIEFGANLDDGDIVETAPYQSGTLNILFSGVDWERKGGDIAVETTRVLREKYNVDAILTIVGIREMPKSFKELSYVRNLGFLNKNDADEYRQYIEAIRGSKLLLLPTKAECAGIVFCEAAAYGLPVFTHDTGGVGNYVVNGVNGYRLPLGANGEDFADRIYKTVQTSEIAKLHDGARDIYQKKLNWTVWSERFKKIINDYERKQTI